MLNVIQYMVMVISGLPHPYYYVAMYYVLCVVLMANSTSGHGTTLAIHLLANNSTFTVMWINVHFPVNEKIKNRLPITTTHCVESHRMNPLITFLTFCALPKPLKEMEVPFLTKTFFYFLK